MEELKKKIVELAKKVSQAVNDLRLDEKETKLKELKIKMSQSDFWQDQEKAKAVSQEASFLEDQISTWYSMTKDQEAEDLLLDLENNFSTLSQEYEQLSKALFLQGPHDNYPAIITINAGAGGVDAQDWAQMLERMYLRFAENQNWNLVHLDRSVGSEAGIKSSTFKITGPQAYGYLKNEAGVHRLVRLSPYDSDHARHTSFAMLEILPEIIDAKVEINEDDLKIDTFRASGHGGQSVNKSDSAVRITHLPTGLIAGCQNERSQMQNKKNALIYLKSKLQRYFELEKEEERKALKGEYTEAAWGNQIRSYVLHPYKLVKDHRTNYEVSDPDRVLSGDIMPFIEAKLQQSLTEK
mgnify:FL=1